MLHEFAFIGFLARVHIFCVTRDFFIGSLLCARILLSATRATKILNMTLSSELFMVNRGTNGAREATLPEEGAIQAGLEGLAEALSLKGGRAA